MERTNEMVELSNNELKIRIMEWVELKEKSIRTPSHNKTAEELMGTFYTYDKKANVWVGVDNSTDDCWVEEFKTKEEVIKWLEAADW